MSYEPLPGTIPSRALHWLRMQPVGTEVSTAVLADAVGADPTSLSPSLVPALNHGLVKRRKRADHPRNFWWSLGDGIPLEKPTDDEPQERHALAKPAAALAPAVRTTVPAPGVSLRFYAGVTLDRRLLIEHGGQRIELDAEQALLVSRLVVQMIEQRQ